MLIKIEVRNKITDFLFGYRIDGIGTISTPSYGIPKWRVFENRRIDKALQSQELEYLKSDAYAKQCVHNYFAQLANKRLRNNKGRFIKGSSK